MATKKGIFLWNTGHVQVLTHYRINTVPSNLDTAFHSWSAREYQGQGSLKGRNTYLPLGGEISFFPTITMPRVIN